jgi:hypothetical protein
MWHVISSPSEAESLMQTFGSFHDGCIRNLQVWGGYFVGPGLSMSCPDTPDLKCRVLVQRQWDDPSAIELLFDGVSHISISATAGYDRIISRATLRAEEGRIVWSPDMDFDESKYEFGNSSAIVATRLWWRVVADGLGPCSYQPSEVPNGFAL